MKRSVLILLVAGISLLSYSRVHAGATLTITDGPSGSFTIVNTGTNGEDDSVKVVNNSSRIIQQLAVSGPTVFGFDGDGVFGGGSYIAPNESFSGSANSGFVSFTGITPFGVPGIAPGSSSLFGVENESSDRNNIFQASVTRSAAIPEPTSMVLFGMTMGAAGFFGWRRRKQSATV